MLSISHWRKKSKPYACAINLFLCLMLGFKSIIVSADDSSQDKLEQLNHQINQIQQIITTVHDKRYNLTSKLAVAEKKMGRVFNQLHTLQQHLISKQQKMAQLTLLINQCNKQLATQQHFLATHVNIRYRMGQFQPIKWLIDQDNADMFDKLLSFHHYLIHSRQQLISIIKTTNTELTQRYQQLETDARVARQLQHHLQNNQEKLQRIKKYHATIIEALDQNIQDKNRKLIEFKHNKHCLSQLISHIVEKDSAPNNQLSFANMRHKLLKPVGVDARFMHLQAHGIIFLAQEGMPVNAVHTGQVVFSDWLNGYGLLLIIDHGQGYMTLYAHNQSLFKKKGVLVQSGEQIATVGHTGGSKKNGLYFEIRAKGKPISAKQWLVT